MTLWIHLAFKSWISRGAAQRGAAMGVPSILFSLQLVYFGTYLPHRADVQPFAARYRARSNDLLLLASLLTCFHFGYHHEHHRKP